MATTKSDPRAPARRRGAPAGGHLEDLHTGIRTADVAQKERKARLLKLGRTIRTIRGDVTQSELAERLSDIRAEEIQQTSISRWENGMVDLSVELLRDIETALNLKAGSIILSAGYVLTDEFDIRSMLRSDSKMHPDLRGDVEAIYLKYVETSAKLWKAEAGTKRRTTAIR